MFPTRTFEVGGDSYEAVALDQVTDRQESLPLTVQVLLENAVRGGRPTAGAVERLAAYQPDDPPSDVAFRPERVLLQDFTGVPVVADLAAIRDAVAEAGGDPSRVDPAVPVELVIDHSVVVDVARRPDALEQNLRFEHERNAERYRFLRWGQQAFERLLVFPPGAGICHQVNLEHLARVVMVDDGLARPDAVLGTDSHTPMVNGLGVLGWGVGGIEAEAAMLGVPVTLGAIRVVGLRLTGELQEGVTATDLVLTITELLRERGVVGSFVEVIGTSVATLSVEDRATIANMSPEFGSTATLFPVDDATVRYLAATGRDPAHVALVETYAKEQGWWAASPPDSAYAEVIELDLASVEPSVAGPRRPQDRIPLARLGEEVAEALAGSGQPVGIRSKGQDSASSLSFPASDPPSATAAPAPRRSPEPVHQHDPHAATEPRSVQIDLDGAPVDLRDGHLVIAAITSCTNTSNPAVMLAAGLVAKQAVARGLAVPSWVKTSLAPGSPVVIDYLEHAGLLDPLAELGFHLVGFGCTTCIGNSGPLAPEVSAGIAEGDLSVAAVLSGNRNFEGRIHPEVRLNFLASPPLVVALALAGTSLIDPVHDPLATDANGEPVRLADLWPTSDEIGAARGGVTPEAFRSRYHDLSTGDERWRALDAGTGSRYGWAPDSTYIRRPPFLDPGASVEVGDVHDARALLVLGDSVTTDHISPAGVIRAGGPAADWLEGQGVPPAEFSSYGARRGNHEVMVRGTFANVRLRNLLVPGSEGGVSRHLPSGDEGSVYEVAERYRADGTPLVVLAGENYGAGSSRDWAAKGTALLGIRAVVARSFERIHRSNLIGMGVVPLQFLDGESIESLGLTGEERFTIEGLDALRAGDTWPDEVEFHADGRRFRARLRVESSAEVEQLRAGGILPFVVRSSSST
jgi:aconitate hydratase